MFIRGTDYRCIRANELLEMDAPTAARPLKKVFDARHCAELDIRTDRAIASNYHCWSVVFKKGGGPSYSLSPRLGTSCCKVRNRWLVEYVIQKYCNFARPMYGTLSTMVGCFEDRGSDN